MSEGRDRKSKRLEDRHLPRRVRQMIVPADDMGNLHKSIIDDDGEVICRIAVGPQNDKIIQYGIVEDDPALNEILDHRVTFLRRLKAKRGIPRRIRKSQTAAAAVIARRQSLSFSLLAAGVEFFGLADTPVGLTFFEQLHGMVAIELHTLRLPEGAFIPIKSHPFHPFNDGLNGFLG